MANGPRGGGHGLSQQTVAAGSGTWIPNVHSITQRRGPMSVKGMELRLHEHGGLPPRGLNSARAAASCRSVRDAILQVSLRLQGCQSAVAGKRKERISRCETGQMACDAGCRSTSRSEAATRLAAWQRCAGCQPIFFRACCGPLGLIFTSHFQYRREPNACFLVLAALQQRSQPPQLRPPPKLQPSTI